MKTVVVASLAAAVALAWAAPASAQRTADPGPGYRTVETDDGYLAEFTDDPLGAGVHAQFGGDITVRPNPYRVSLIRPRASFVVELVKTVEQLD